MKAMPRRRPVGLLGELVVDQRAIIIEQRPAQSEGRGVSIHRRMKVRIVPARMPGKRAATHATEHGGGRRAQAEGCFLDGAVDALDHACRESTMKGRLTAMMPMITAFS